MTLVLLEQELILISSWFTFTAVCVRALLSRIVTHTLLLHPLTYVFGGLGGVKMVACGVLLHVIVSIQSRTISGDYF